MTTVADLTVLLAPMFAGMLHPRELRSLEFRFVRVDDGADGPTLPPETLLDDSAEQHAARCLSVGAMAHHGRGGRLVVPLVRGRPRGDGAVGAE
ncbi:hypothetical protein BIU90_07075 [Curtobacterium sp. MCBA15_001]|nr:hypothetical protein BIU90_07075 [Curtobacterium sp. MCBA15_001]